MSTVPLPDDPSLEQLRKQAKTLRDLARAGVPGAVDLFAAHYPDGLERVTLAGAQLVTARHYGFASWARLKHHLEVIERYSRAPDEITATADPTDELLVPRLPPLRRRRHAGPLGARRPAPRRTPRARPRQRARGGGRRRRGCPRRAPHRRPEPGPAGGRPVPMGAVAVPGLRPPRPARRRGRHPGRHPAPARPRRRPQRRVPVARADHTVHRPDRRPRQWRGRPARAPARLRPRRTAPRRRRRRQRRPGAVQPPVPARRPPPRAALPVRARAG